MEKEREEKTKNAIQPEREIRKLKAAIEKETENVIKQLNIYKRSNARQ